MDETAKQRHRADVVRRGPRMPRCALRHRGGCSGPLEADHVVEIQWLKLWLAEARRQGVKLDCPDCEGRGWQPVLVAGIAPACCGRFRPDGDCCGVPVPEPVDEVEPVPCSSCDDGVVTLDTLTADGRNGWMLCERHHGLKTRALLKPSIAGAELPATVFMFTEEFKCAHLLDRKPFAVTS